MQQKSLLKTKHLLQRYIMDRYRLLGICIGVTPLRQGFAGQADYGLENLDDKIIKVEIIKFLRDIIKFKLVEELVKQIEEDVKKIKLIY